MTEQSTCPCETNCTCANCTCQSCSGKTARPLNGCGAENCSCGEGCVCTPQTNCQTA